MTKITLEKFGVSVTISDSDNDSGILEHIGFTQHLVRSTDNALKKFCSKIQSYRCNKSEIMRLIGADDEEDEEEDENEGEEWADDEEGRERTRTRKRMRMRMRKSMKKRRRRRRGGR